MKETPRNPRLRAMTTAFDRKTIALNVVEHQTLIFRSFVDCQDIVRFMNCPCQPSYETLIVVDSVYTKGHNNSHGTLGPE